MNEYYMAQAELEQESLMEMVMYKQHLEEQRMELNADARREADEDRRESEC